MMGSIYNSQLSGQSKNFSVFTIALTWKKTL